jgi:hypothetical protein
MEEFDFIGPNDHPALLAITTPEALQIARSALQEMNYKVHAVDNHPEFVARCNQVNYEIIILEENFAGGTLIENVSLQTLQSMPMNQRRHATTFLIGESFESLNTLQAFAQSVHCVLNFAEMQMLTEVIQKTIAENDLFLSTFREVQRRVYQKGG